MDYIQSRMFAAEFGNIVTVLMQSKQHRDLRLSDLYEVVVPPLLNKQFRVAEAKSRDSGPSIPAGLILWASVSKDVHERLIQSTELPLKLEAKEWKSGDIIWIIDAVGDQRFILPLIKGLQTKEMKGKPVHCKVRSKDGVYNRVLADERAVAAAKV